MEKSLFWVISGGLFFILLITIGMSGGFNLPENAGGWVYEYQTLIASIFAGLSLFLAWKSFSDKRQRQKYAARSKLNDAIDDLCLYADRCFNYIHEDETKPEKCYEAIETFKNSIEFLDQGASEAVYHIVSFYQIHNARLRSYEERPDAITSNIVERLYDCVYLRCVAAKLFEYARNRANSVHSKKPSLTEMRSAFNAITNYQFFGSDTIEDRRLKKVLKKN